MILSLIVLCVSAGLSRVPVKAKWKEDGQRVLSVRDPQFPGWMIHLLCGWPFLLVSFPAYRHWLDPICWLVAMVELVTVVLKIWTGKERPNGVGNDSFPSRHTTRASAWTAFILLAVYRTVQFSPWITLVCFFQFAMALIMSASRVVDHFHTPSDVIFSAILGLTLAWFLFP